MHWCSYVKFISDPFSACLFAFFAFYVPLLHVSAEIQESDGFKRDADAQPALLLDPLRENLAIEQKHILHAAQILHLLTL